MTKGDVPQFMRKDHGQRGFIRENIQQSATHDDGMANRERFQRGGEQHAAADFRLDVQVVGDLQIIHNRLQHLGDFSVRSKNSGALHAIQDVVFRLPFPLVLAVNRDDFVGAESAVIGNIFGGRFHLHAGEFGLLSGMLQVITPEPGLAFHLELAHECILGIRFFGVNIGRQPQPRLQVHAPTVKMEVEVSPRRWLVIAVDANDVEILVFNPYAAHKVGALGVGSGHNVINQGADLSQELLPQVFQVVIVFIKLVIKEDELHEALGNVIHLVKIVQTFQHPAKESRLVAPIKLSVIDSLLIQHQPPQEILVAARAASQFFVGFHVLDVGLHHGRELVHVLHKFGLLVEDFVGVRINLCGLVFGRL